MAASRAARTPHDDQTRWSEVAENCSSAKGVDEMLRYYGELVRRCVAVRLARGEPRKYLYEPAAVYPSRGSKNLRPALCIATALAFGGKIEDVLNSAVALELLHNAFLIHDDVEDGSKYRRGGPTLHTQFGLGIAINAGDALAALSINQLMENRNILGPSLAWHIFGEFDHLARQTVEGQAMELGWVHDNRFDLSEADYLRMVLKKTCWYTAVHPCRIGALVGLKGVCQPERFNRFGYYLGAAFQIQDDVLNLVGDENLYGKETSGDLFEGKRTLVLIHLLHNCTWSERHRLRRFLTASHFHRGPRETEWILRLIGKYRSIEYAHSCACNLASAALAEFPIAYRDAAQNEFTDFIRSVVRYMVEREA
jgi:geranylgeranyl diphosphate synthase type II